MNALAHGIPAFAETFADDLPRERKCCECDAPAQFGEPTCGNVECLRSLQAALFVDLDGDDRRTP